MVHRVHFLSHNFVSGLCCTLKPLKIYKKKLFPYKPMFFQPWMVYLVITLLQISSRHGASHIFLRGV